MMQPLILAADGGDNLVLGIIFITFLVLVVAGQRLSQWIFKRFFSKNDEPLPPELKEPEV